MQAKQKSPIASAPCGATPCSATFRNTAFCRCTRNCPRKNSERCFLCLLKAPRRLFSPPTLLKRPSPSTTFPSSWTRAPTKKCSTCLFASLQRCSFAVLQFCSFAVLQFCSFASAAVVIGSDTFKLETFVFFTLSNRYDPSVGMSCLREVRVSKANAAQRAGRAGRVREGFTYHLFLRHEEEEMPAQQLPEMLRCPLESIALRIKTLRLGTACLPSWSN